jgi:Tol biopolymer transport system component
MRILTLDASAGSCALWVVMVGLMVFSSCAGPVPEQSGGRETASASSGPVTSESSPHPFAGDSTWIAYQTDRGGQEGVWLVHPDGTEDHQIAMDVAEQQLLPDWSPDGGRLVFTTRGGSTEPLMSMTSPKTSLASGSGRLSESQYVMKP